VMNNEMPCKKIKILFVVEQSAVSYKYFENILIELNKIQAVDVEVFNLVRDEAVNNHLKQFCSRIITFPNDQPYRKQIFNIVKIIKESKPDIIHAHEVIPSFYAAIGLIVGFSGTKLIFHRHHSFYRDKATLFMERIAFLRCNLAISVSKTTQQTAFLEHPFSKKKIIQLYNGINVSDNSLPLPADLNKFKGDYKIVLLSRLKSRKGHNTAIDAIDIVRKKIPGIRLFFAGEGDYRKDIEKMISEKQLHQHVILLGDVPNIQPLLQQIDISILPSESEAFNLSILETFSCKRLSIASDLPSIRECISEEKTGVLIQPGNAKQLAEKIIFYLEDKAKRNEIALNGYNLYLEQFTTIAMVNKMITIYERLLNKL
jgi:glycosyltransferase involved in cell wall biosynthesis